MTSYTTQSISQVIVLKEPANIPSRYYIASLIVDNHDEIFASVLDGEIIITDHGKYAMRAIEQLQIEFPTITIIDTVILSDHMHLVLEFHPESYTSLTPEAFVESLQNLISKHISSCKSCNKNIVWQKGDYMYPVREESLSDIINYLNEEHIRWFLALKNR